MSRNFNYYLNFKPEMIKTDGVNHLVYYVTSAVRSFFRTKWKKLLFL